MDVTVCLTSELTWVIQYSLTVRDDRPEPSNPSGVTCFGTNEKYQSLQLLQMLHSQFAAEVPVLAVILWALLNRQ